MAKVAAVKGKVNTAKGKGKAAKATAKPVAVARKPKPSAAAKRQAEALKKFAPLSRAFGTAYKAANTGIYEAGRLYGLMLDTGLKPEDIASRLRAEHGKWAASEKFAITVPNLRGWRVAWDTFGKHDGIRSEDGKNYLAPEDVLKLNVEPARIPELVEAIKRPVDTVRIVDLASIARGVKGGTVSETEARAKVDALISGAPAAKPVVKPEDTLKLKRAELVKAERELAALTARVNALRAEVATLDKASKGGKVTTRKVAGKGKGTATITA